MQILFWILFFVLFYIYIGYGVLLLVLVKIKRRKAASANRIDSDKKAVTMVVAAWNEEDCIEDKIRNTFELDYPEDKFKFIIITDGSTDRTVEIVKKYPEITLLHSDERGGKSAALNRAMTHVDTPVVVFSDANALLNQQAINEIVKHYDDPSVGCVAGEKRVMSENLEGDAAGFGEGIYWKYESLLKRKDAELYSCVGAAGELFSIRTALYQHVAPDTILDDFVISLKVAMRGYKIAYEPNAYAKEYGSVNVIEEMKRKIRISAGGIQAMLRLSPLLNIGKYGVLSFQYVSHRLMRWTVGPVALFSLLPVNFILWQTTLSNFYGIILLLQLTFYIFAAVGYYLGKRGRKIKAFYIPFYFLMMNYCVVKGGLQFFQGQQSVKWERSKRVSI